MANRIPASMRTREELSALIEGKLATPSGKDELVKLATRLIVEEALEGEAGDALGRDYYEHGAEPGRGYRNGYRTGRLKTAEGAMEYGAPQVADRPEPFRSRIREHLKGHTQALENLAVELLARGLSVRDIEDAFKDESGRLLLSRTAVSELGERLWEDYQAFAQRDLSEYEIVYLFIDGIAERLRPGQKREPVMAAWCFTAEGRKVLLHLMAGSKEDTETVTAFFEDMKLRGLNDPLLVVSDGAPGIIKAIEVCFPRSARQRCLAHRMRNLAVKVPEDLWPEFKARAQAAYQAPSRAIARELAKGIEIDYGRELVTAVTCFMDDFEACIAHLRFPVTHRRAIRTTNLLERLFVEERRRLKIIPNAFGEKAVLKLMFGAMIRASERWHCIRFTEFERRQMAAVKQELDEEYESATALSSKPAEAAPRSRISSSSRT
ncbi:MAG: IS256 family transposase [Aestuariivirgaceae bacterium]